MTLNEGRTGTTDVKDVKYDPQLHTLRSVASSIEDETQRNEAASARFRLYDALAKGDNVEAGHWLDALEAAIAVATIPNMAMRKTAERALATIRKGLKA